jgi:hypothetical protein
VRSAFHGQCAHEADQRRFRRGVGGQSMQPVEAGNRCRYDDVPDAGGLCAGATGKSEAAD